MASGRCIALCLALALAFSAASVADARQLRNTGSCGVTPLTVDVLATVNTGQCDVIKLKLQVFIDATNELLACLPDGSLLVKAIINVVDRILCAVASILEGLHINVDVKLGSLLSLDVNLNNGLPDWNSMSYPGLAGGVTHDHFVTCIHNWRNAAKDLLYLCPVSDLLTEVVALVDGILGAIGKLCVTLQINLDAALLILGELDVFALVNIDADIDIASSLAVSIKAALLDVKVKALVLIKLLPEGDLLNAVIRLVNAVLRAVAKLLIRIGIDVDLIVLLEGFESCNSDVIDLNVLAQLALPSIPAGCHLPPGCTPDQVKQALLDLKVSIKALIVLVPGCDILDAVLICLTKIVKLVVDLLGFLVVDLDVNLLLGECLHDIPWNKCTNISLLNGVFVALNLTVVVGGLLSVVGGLLGGLGR